MSWFNTSKPLIVGFRPKIETDFSEHFYKNVNPIGMDKFKSVVVDNQIHASRSSGELKKSQLNKKENEVKNSLNVRWKLSGSDRDKINKVSKISQYEIYALLNTSGRYT